MKGIIWNCKNVKWKHEKDDINREKECLLVYVCCENGDTHKDSKEVARRIMQLNKKRYSRNNIVIFPYAHLSDNILHQDQAKELIYNVADILKEKLKVSIMGFNKNKEINIHLLPANGDVSYFSY